METESFLSTFCCTNVTNTTDATTLMDFTNITNTTVMLAFTNITNTTPTIVLPDEDSLHYDRYEFLKRKPAVAIISIVILLIEAIIGTVGNVITLLVFATRSNLRKPEHIFVINLAISDFYVTTVADPMAIIAKIEGKQFFDQYSGFCQIIGSLCTVSCFTSLISIGMMSINRFVYICVHDKYKLIFTKRNSILICVSEYLVGAFFVLMNLANIGDHSFDYKILECIWDRMTTYSYTVVFFVTLIWVPSVVIGVCYLKIFLFIKAHKKRMMEQKSVQSKTKIRRFQLAKTLFLIYAVFVTCWAPYAVLAVVDTNNEAPHDVYIFIVIFAHLHPSVNWIIYYKTNKHFAQGLHKLFRVCSRNSSNDDVTELQPSSCVQSDIKFTNAALTEPQNGKKV